MSNAIEEKRQREKKIVSQMITLYCVKNHGKRKDKDGNIILCSECAELDEYARSRSDKCPFMETKTFCNNCKVHCYSPQMRERIRAVMRFSGPRMITRHPVAVIRHMIESGKEKRRLKSKQ